MIETYKIVSGKYDSMTAPMIPGSHSYITRGQDLRLHKGRAKLAGLPAVYALTQQLIVS